MSDALTLVIARQADGLFEVAARGGDADDLPRAWDDLPAQALAAWFSMVQDILDEPEVSEPLLSIMETLATKGGTIRVIRR